MDNIFTLFEVDLPPNLKQKIIQAYHAKVSPKAIAKYLGLSLADVKKVLAQDALQRRKQVELEAWQALM